jgi:hypothetical protein
MHIETSQGWQVPEPLKYPSLHGPQVKLMAEGRWLGSEQEVHRHGIDVQVLQAGSHFSQN